MYGEQEKKEIRDHLFHYMNDPETTETLRNICSKKCKDYLGSANDYTKSVCENCPILNMWYELEYYRWYNTY
jgi:hypothetical protein